MDLADETTLNSEGVASKAAVSARQIKSINLNFQSNADFKAELQKASFAWVDKLAAGSADATDSSSADE